MLDLNPLFDFSRTNCVAICAFLVPANLLATLQTILLVAFQHPFSHIQKSVGLSIFLALVMVLHVLTWWMIGVVMAPTYILLLLASVCLIINCWAIAHPLSILSLLRVFRFSKSAH